MDRRMRVVDGPHRGEFVRANPDAVTVVVGGTPYRVVARRRGPRRIFELTTSRP